MLGCGIVIGLFFHLKFFFLALVLLVLGAKLEQTIAEHLNVSKISLILAMVAMVDISLINYVFKLLPTGLQTKPRERSPGGVRALFYDIEKSKLVYTLKVLEMNFDCNLLHDNGDTPRLRRDEGQHPQGRVADPQRRRPSAGDQGGRLARGTGAALRSSEVADVLKQARH